MNQFILNLEITSELIRELANVAKFRLPIDMYLNFETDVRIITYTPNFDFVLERVFRFGDVVLSHDCKIEHLSIELQFSNDKIFFQSVHDVCSYKSILTIHCSFKDNKYAFDEVKIINKELAGENSVLKLPLRKKTDSINILPEKNYGNKLLECKLDAGDILLLRQNNADRIELFSRVQDSSNSLLLILANKYIIINDGFKAFHKGTINIVVEGGFNMLPSRTSFDVTIYKNVCIMQETGTDRIYLFYKIKIEER